MVSRKPSSIRLAITISPSRVNKGTVPISRMYIRTGSMVFPTTDSIEPIILESTFMSSPDRSDRLSFSGACS